MNFVITLCIFLGIGFASMPPLPRQPGPPVTPKDVVCCKCLGLQCLIDK